MKEKAHLLVGVDSLTDQLKLDLFNVEELETRLEMIGSLADYDPHDNPKIPPGVPCNDHCWYGKCPT